MSSTQFVEIYHPLLADTISDPAEVTLQSLDEWYARGWLLVDPDAPPPIPSTPYYTTAAADSRFVPRPDGGADGQALIKAGAGVVWGTVAGSGGGTATVTDNGDGTFTATGSAVTDNGDGTFTIAA